jgi:ADP-ribosyl-[dinitrogen reductase] hydrolase
VKNARGLTAASLVGLAIGDALGAPFEKLPLDHPDYLWWNGQYIDHSPRPPPYGHNLKKGQFTDDTQMAMALAESILKVKRYTPIAALEAYIEWFRGSPRGIGGTIKRALRDSQESLDKRNLLQAFPVTRSDVQGNGVLMRLAPLSVWLIGKDCVTGEYSPSSAHDRIIRETQLTHNGPRSITTATDLHAMIQLAHTTQDKSQLRKNFGPGPLNAGESCTDVVTLDRALGCFLSTETFAGAVQMAVRLGDDTDTVAAITGAIAGAWYGMEGIPQEYLQGLEQTDYIQSVQSKLYALATTRMS